MTDKDRCTADITAVPCSPTSDSGRDQEDGVGSVGGMGRILEGYCNYSLKTWQIHLSAAVDQGVIHQLEEV